MSRKRQKKLVHKGLILEKFWNGQKIRLFKKMRLKLKQHRKFVGSIDTVEYNAKKSQISSYRIDGEKVKSQHLFNFYLK